MAVPLDTLVTSRPSISALFAAGHDEAPEVIGQHLFLHHVLHAICQNADQSSADEQMRGMALCIWDGFDLSKRDFWSSRAITARLVRFDREDFLLLDGSTPLSRDHAGKAHSAWVAYKQALAADTISLPDTASIADTEYTDVTDVTEDVVDTEAGVGSKAGDSSNDAPASDNQEPSIKIEGWDDIGLQVEDFANMPMRGVIGGNEEAEVELGAAHNTRDDYGHGEDAQPCSQQNVPAEAQDLRVSQHSDLAITRRSNDEEDLDTVEHGPSERLNKDVDEVKTPPILRSDGLPPKVSSSALDASATTPELLTETASASVAMPAWSIGQISGPLDWAEEMQEQAEQDAAARAEQKTGPVEQTADVDIPDKVDIPQEVPTRTLRIGSLRPSVDVIALEATFEKFGVIESAEIKPTRDCASSALIRYKTVEGAMAAKARMNGKSVLNDSDPPKINFAEDQNNMQRSSAKPRTQIDAKITPVEAVPAEVSTSEPAMSSSEQLAEVERTAPYVPHSHCNSGPPFAAKVSEKGKLTKAKHARSAYWQTWKPVPQTKGLTPRPPKAVEQVPLAKWETPVKVRDFGSAASDEPEPADDGGKGKDFFFFHALPVICEDLEVDEPDAYATSIAEAMWQELSAQTKRSWIEDSRSLRGYSMRKPGLLSAQKKFQGSKFTKDYRSQILKTLAQRNGGELKYLQPELKKLLSKEKNERRAERERERRKAEYATEKAEQATCDEAQKAKVASPENTGEQPPANPEAESVDPMVQPDQAEPDQIDSEEPVVNAADLPERIDSAVSLDIAIDVDAESQPQPQPHTPKAEVPLPSTIAKDPPPPYESDSAKADPWTEVVSSKKKKGAASQPSVKESAKSAMKRLSRNRLGKA